MRTFAVNLASFLVLSFVTAEAATRLQFDLGFKREMKKMEEIQRVSELIRPSGWQTAINAKGLIVLFQADESISPLKVEVMILDATQKETLFSRNVVYIKSSEPTILTHEGEGRASELSIKVLPNLRAD